VNAGGVINVAGEHFGWTRAEVEVRAARIGVRLAEIIDHAEAMGVTTARAVDERATGHRLGTHGRYARATKGSRWFEGQTAVHTAAFEAGGHQLRATPLRGLSASNLFHLWGPANNPTDWDSGANGDF
jgi:hypothetical protein